MATPTLPLPMIRAAIALVVLVGTTIPLAVPAVATADHPPHWNSIDGIGPLRDLEPGDSGDAVAEVQRRLARAGLYHGEVDGEFGKTTSSAVLALHKLLGSERTHTFGVADWLALDSLAPPGVPNRPFEPDRLEIDLGNQLMYLVEDRKVTAVLHTSTGGSYTYWSVRNGKNVRAGTPRGDFTLFRFDPGWRCDPVTDWCVYNYWAFTTYYGLHGYPSVPAYPASHGCARLHTWDSDWLSERLFLGMPIHIWDEKPDVHHEMSDGRFEHPE